MAGTRTGDETQAPLAGGNDCENGPRAGLGGTVADTGASPTPTNEVPEVDCRRSDDA